MAELGTASAWLLAGVFAWAAVAKLRDRPATAASLAGLGLPAPRAFAVALPAWEVVLAATLLAAPTVGAALALATLAAFTVAIAAWLRRGVRAACACFGAGSRSGPVSAVTLARNVLLALAAAVALAAEAAAPSLPGLVAATAAALAGATGLALAGLRARTGRLLALGDLPSAAGARQGRA